MTAPTTMTVTGTYLKPDGTPMTGRVELRANLAASARFVNNDNIIEASTLGVAIPTMGATPGTITQTVVRCSAGYIATEYLDGQLPHVITIADGAGPIDLGTYS